MDHVTHIGQLIIIVYYNVIMMIHDNDHKIFIPDIA